MPPNKAGSIARSKFTRLHAKEWLAALKHMRTACPDLTAQQRQNELFKVFREKYRADYDKCRTEAKEMLRFRDEDDAR